jgi:GT2 family glycosyltransferase
MKKSFDIVIVNWNSSYQLKECIESIYKASLESCNLNSVIVVDNDSSDDSIDILDRNQNNLIIIENEVNEGFSKACNIGAMKSNSNFILFLNPDTLIFEDTFSNLFNYIDKDDEKYIAVYSVQLVDENKIVQRSCAKIPKMFNFINRGLGLNKISSKLFPSYTMQYWDHNDTRVVDQVIGAFFMINSKIYHELNGFDEQFFVYYEELDLSTRIIQNGYKTKYITEAQAFHKGGGVSENVKAKRLFFNTRSKMLYGFKHLNLFYGIILFLFTLTIEPITRFIYLILTSKYQDIKELYSGYVMLYKDSIHIFKKGMTNE